MAKSYPHRAAQKLVAFRKAKDWTQADLAAALRRSRNRIALLETGQVDPTPRMQRMLKALAGVEPNDWFEAALPEDALALLGEPAE